MVLLVFCENFLRNMFIVNLGKSLVIIWTYQICYWLLLELEFLYMNIPTNGEKIIS